MHQVFFSFEGVKSVFFPHFFGVKKGCEIWLFFFKAQQRCRKLDLGALDLLTQLTL